MKSEVTVESLSLHVNRGITPKYTESTEDSIIVLNQKCIRDFKVSLVPSRRNDLNKRKITEGKALKKFDVLINSTGVGTLGRVAQYFGDNDSATVDSHVTIVRSNPEIVDPIYFGYLMKSKQSVIESFAEGSTGQTELNRNSVKELLVEIVNDLPTQKRIAEFLLNIDEKIKTNTQTNQTLEQIAQALFKSWFVDFDPVHAKAAGNAPAHMDAQTAALFPSSFGDDGLPMGWHNSVIGDEVQIFGGGTPSTKEPAYWEGGEFNWCTPKDLSPLVSPVLLNTSRKITESGLKKISSGLLPAGTLLMSSRAPVGYLAISQIPVAVNQGFIAMKCTKRLSNLYTLFWCEQNMEKIKNNAGGSAFAEISKTNFKPIPVICPNEEIITALNSYIEPVFSKVVSNLKENQTLAELRDTLLPKLLSGEITVDASAETTGVV